MTSTWGGRRAQRLVASTLLNKGTTCHLCDLEGADSADHDPPRSVLLAQGVANPDQARYLFPAHRYPCNIKRKAREITDELRAELRAARLAALGLAETAVPLSPRFASRRPFFPTGHDPRKVTPPVSPRGAPEKTGRRQTRPSRT
jgi:hypothetical protein